VDLTGDVAAQAAGDFLLGASFGGAATDVVAGGDIGAHPGQHDGGDRFVESTVTAAVEPVADGVAQLRKTRNLSPDFRNSPRKLPPDTATYPRTGQQPEHSATNPFRPAHAPHTSCIKVTICCECLERCETNARPPP